MVTESGAFVIWAWNPTNVERALDHYVPCRLKFTTLEERGLKGPYVGFNSCAKVTYQKLRWLLGIERELSSALCTVVVYHHAALQSYDSSSGVNWFGRLT